MARDGDDTAVDGRVPDGAGPLGVPARWLPARLQRWWRWPGLHARGLGLPGKLLILTGLFVMLAEVLIFVPSLANFRVNWLNDRINAAHLAALAGDAVPGGAIPPMLRNELLSTAQVKGIAIKRSGQRRLVLPPDGDLKVDATYDLRPMAKGFADQLRSRFGLIADAMKSLAMSPNSTIRVLGQPTPPRGAAVTAASYGNNDFVEILLPGAPLLDAMYRFGLNILGLSIIISGITAALVYLALSGLLVRPMLRLAHNMTRFREKPEDATRIIVPSSRTDEIGVTERELARMQADLAQMLQQKTRLAQLGLAVAKINHDLRNMLATAQLMSDRLAALPDPAVQRLSPKLIASLDRAIAFCNETLRYGQADEATSLRDRFKLRPLAEEVGEGLGLPRESLAWQLDVAEDLEVDADRGQLFRILNNLVRNAIQAIETAGDQPGAISLVARRVDVVVEIEIVDNGPGVPEKALANLFQPFRGGTRKGGSGLGLAIAAELVTAHGGQLRHVPVARGATFRFDIVDRPASDTSGA